MERNTCYLNLSVAEAARTVSELVERAGLSSRMVDCHELRQGENLCGMVLLFEKYFLRMGSRLTLTAVLDNLEGRTRLYWTVTGGAGMLRQSGDSKTAAEEYSEALREKLAGRGFFLSSANSINWGRVLPQIVYYISAYCDLLREGRIQKGERINVCVPTGNFGNILAAYYAREMGVPIGRLICASNSNNVLTDFLCTGVYDRNRTFYNTMSPSMDILISSNLERLLFSLSNHDDAEARGYMEELARSGRYEVSPAIKGRLEKLFAAGFCDDAQTQKVIGRMWQEHRYLIDPHTAVAVNVYQQYLQETGDLETPAIIASTASPYKFAASVLEALTGERGQGSEFDKVAELSALTGTQIPQPIADLQQKPLRFAQVCNIAGMEMAVLGTLGIQ